jgi:hypothetical protein
MRVLPLATILLLASTAGPSLAKQDQPNAPAQRTTQSQSQTAPAQGQSQSQPQTVQPERTPQQSEQARKDERERAEDGRNRESWKAEERDNDHGDGDRAEQNRMERRMGHMGRMDWDDDAMARMMDMCDRMMERMHHGIRGHDVYRDRNEGYRTGREERDGYAKSFDEEHRASRRVRICIEDENGDEYCRYRR